MSRFENMSVRERLAVAVLPIALIGGGAILAFNGSDEPAKESSASPATTGLEIELAAANQPIDNFGSLTEAEPTTDTELRDLDLSTYNCGGHLRDPAQTPDKYDASYSIEYTNANPELGKRLTEFYDEAIGAEAFDSLLTNGIVNSDTPAENIVDGQDRLNQFLHARNAVTLKHPRTFANFSCVSGDTPNIHRASKKPTITVGEGQNVEGIILDKAGVEDFMKKAKPQADGLPAVEIILISDKDAEVKDQLWVVVTNAYGCDNPNLRLVDRKYKRHETTTTTGRGDTTTSVIKKTTTTGGESTTSYLTTTTSINSKNDPRQAPAGNTSIPADSDHGDNNDTPGTAPAIPGTSPAHVPRPTVVDTSAAPTTTEKRPPASTAAQPSSTVAPAPASTTVGSTAPQGPRPTQP